MIKKVYIIFFVTFSFIFGGNTYAVGNEVLLYRGEGLQFSKSDNGFFSLVVESDTNDHGPNNWLTPIDYWNGQFQVRYHIEQLGNAPGKLQTCIWTRKNGWYPETCSGTISYSQVGHVDYNNKPYPNAQENGLGDPWYRKEGIIDYANPQYFRIRVVLRGESGCNVMPHAGNNVCGKTANNTYSQAYNETFPIYENLKFGVTIVLVPAGQDFSGWENYPLNSSVTPLPSQPATITPEVSVSPINTVEYDLNDDGKFDVLDLIEMVMFLFA